MEKVGEIKVTDDDGKDGMKFEYGEDKTAELYGWKYEWTSKNLEQDEIKKYAEENLKNATFTNYDKWGSDAEHNALYISGVSGSGKSTVALSLKRPNDTVIHLDGYTENKAHLAKIQDKNFNSYLDKQVPNWRDMTNATKNDNSKVKLHSKEYWEIVDSFTDAIDSYSAKEFVKGNRVIVEGVQIQDGWIGGLDKKNGKPMVVLNTDIDVANSRASERDRKV